MLSAISRSFLGMLVVLQAVQPALASDWMIASDSCGCELEYSCCEPWVVESEPCGCEMETHPSDVCGGETSQPASDKTAEPVPAETQKPETFATPPAETPVPTLEEPTTELPPAPIAVPQTPAMQTPAMQTPATELNTEESNFEELFPGPAPEQQRVTPDSLFDEPAAETEPAETAPAPFAETPADETTSAETPTTEDMFAEPSQEAAESTETPVTEEAVPESETEEPATESNPLDDLFSSPAVETEHEPQTEPQPETESEETEELQYDDPFGQLEFRDWSDRAENISYHARLVRLSTEGVFLAQSSGEIIAVPFSQLSDADLGFVREQVRAQRALLARASTELAANTAH